MISVRRLPKPDTIPEKVIDSFRLCVAWSLALAELGMGTLLSSAHNLTSKTQRRGSFTAYAFLGALFLAARVLTNLSV